MADPVKRGLLAHVRRLEQALKDCERQAHLDRLFASIAHEIKNPLEAITDALYLLEQAGPGQKQLDLKFHREAGGRVGFKVLVVADERSIADTLTAILKLHGYDAIAPMVGLQRSKRRRVSRRRLFSPTW